MITALTVLPAKPASIPKAAPISIAEMTGKKAIRREIRPPYNNRLRMSLPR
jgi:hypothetical protein